jgi:hypothetical protein
MQVQVEASSVRPPAMEVDPLTSSPPLPFQVRLLSVASCYQSDGFEIALFCRIRIWIGIPFRGHGSKAKNENF